MLIIICNIICLVVAVAYTVYAFKKVSKKKYEEKTRLEKGSNWYYVFLSLISIIIASICITVSINNYHSYSINARTPARQHPEGYNIPKMTDDRKMELLRENDVNSNNWNRAKFESRKELIETVLDIESDYLNVKSTPELMVAKMSGDELGSYSRNSDTIYINVNHFEFSRIDEVIETACHEMFHVFQSELCEIYKEGYIDDSTVEQYVEEFDNYIEGEKDFYAYYDQKCEVDARNYAKEAVRLYMIELK